MSRTTVTTTVVIESDDDGLAARVSVLEDETVTLKSDLDALTATVTEYNEDVQAKLADLQGQIDAIGNPAELQASFDALAAAVNAGVAQVGDADGDGNPTTPADPGTGV